MKMQSKLAIIIAAAAVLTGCAGSPLLSQGGHPDIYNRNQAMQTGMIVEATVVQVREVKIASGTTAKVIGGGTGAVLGAALTRKKSTFAKTAVALVGGAAGTLAASAIGQTTGDEVVVKLMDGQYRSIVQERGRLSFKSGQKVLVNINGMESRIIARL